MFKGDPAKKTQERLQPTVDNINKMAVSMSAKSDDDLRAITQDLKQRATSGTSLEDLLPEAFAVRASPTQTASTWSRDIINVVDLPFARRCAATQQLHGSELVRSTRGGSPRFGDYADRVTRPGVPWSTSRYDHLKTTLL